METTQCRAINHEGRPCQSRPVRTSGYCFWHDPELAEERRAWSRKGGTNRANKTRAKKHMPEALTAAELRSYLGTVFTSVIDGSMEPGVGTAAATIARTMVELERVSALEARISDLESERARRGSA